MSDQVLITNGYGYFVVNEFTWQDIQAAQRGERFKHQEFNARIAGVVNEHGLLMYHRCEAHEYTEWRVVEGAREVNAADGVGL